MRAAEAAATGGFTGHDHLSEHAGAGGVVAEVLIVRVYTLLERTVDSVGHGLYLRRAPSVRLPHSLIGSSKASTFFHRGGDGGRPGGVLYTGKLFKKGIEAL